MKVLARPENNVNLWKGEFTCTGAGWYQEGKIPCGCLLEIQATDIQYRDHSDLSGSTERYYGFTCSECGCFTEVLIGDLPSHVRNFAKPYLKKKENNK